MLDVTQKQNECEEPVRISVLSVAPVCSYEIYIYLYQ